MDRGLYLLIYFAGVALLRTHFEKRGFEPTKRATYGFLAGTVSGLCLAFYGKIVRQSTGVEPMSLTELGLWLLVSATITAFAVQTMPKEDNRGLREILDDPENVSIKDRVRAARQKHESTHSD